MYPNVKETSLTTPKVGIACQTRKARGKYQSTYKIYLEAFCSFLGASTGI